MNNKVIKFPIKKQKRIVESQGQLDYEYDVLQDPFYRDGSKRKKWCELSDIEQWFWNQFSNNND